MLELVALLLPLSLDTFAVAAALGATGLTASNRLRVSLLLAGFEAAMPLVGVAVGQALGRAVGSSAEYLAGTALLALGAFLIFGGADDGADTAQMLARARGLAVIGLGISISLDELAIGFGVGLMRLPLGWAIVLIAAQAFIAAQLGVRLGGAISRRSRECAERAAGLGLIALGIIILAARIT